VETDCGVRKELALGGINHVGSGSDEAAGLAFESELLGADSHSCGND
jgi:hypothetical protein